MLTVVFHRQHVTGDSAAEVIVAAEFGLLARVAVVAVVEFQQMLLARGGSVDESHFEVSTVEVDLNAGDSEVWKSLKSILNRSGVLVVGPGVVVLDGARVVLAAHLVFETERKESDTRSSLSASETLDVGAELIVARGLGVIAVWAAAQRAIEALVTTVANALLELAALPSISAGASAGDLLVVTDNIAPNVGVGISAGVVERGVVGDADTVPRAGVRASGAAAAFTSETGEALAVASGAVAQTTTAALLVRVLVDEGAVLRDDGGVQIPIVLFGVRRLGVGRSVKPISAGRVRRREAGGVRALQLRAVRPGKAGLTVEITLRVQVERADGCLGGHTAHVRGGKRRLGGADQNESDQELHDCENGGGWKTKETKHKRSDKKAVFLSLSFDLCEETSFCPLSRRRWAFLFTTFTVDSTCCSHAQYKTPTSTPRRVLNPHGLRSLGQTMKASYVVFQFVRSQAPSGGRTNERTYERTYERTNRATTASKRHRQTDDGWTSCVLPSWMVLGQRRQAEQQCSGCVCCVVCCVAKRNARVRDCDGDRSANERTMALDNERAKRSVVHCHTL